MAQNKTYIAVSCVFTPTGGSATSFTDLERCSYSESGTDVDMLTDGNAVVNGMYLDAIKGELNIESTDLTLLEATSNFALGITGSMTIVLGLRKAGKGIVAGSSRNVVMANAQIRNSNWDAGAVGASKLTLRLGCYDPSGVAAAVYT